MRDFFLNLMSSTSAVSTKNFLAVIIGITLCFICVYEVVIAKEYILPTTTLAGLLAAIFEIKRREKKVKIENRKENGKTEN
jgi:hypothetical protein